MRPLRDTRGRLLPTLGLLVTMAVAGCGTPGSTFTFHEENDLFTPVGSSDRYYTQGLRASTVYPRSQAPPLTLDVAAQSPVLNDTTEAIGVVFGQNVYTPVRIAKRRLLRQDRPYAGWLYVGLLVANVERGDDDPVGDRLDSYELDIGVVGPQSLGEHAQTKVHELIDAPRPRGWDHQLRTEPTLLFRYDQRRRLLAGDDLLGLPYDVLGGVATNVGNVAVHGGASAVVRWGSRVPRDFGVNTIDRTAVDIAPGGGGSGFSWYLFGGLEGRLVLHNLFLDGNTWHDSHSVEKEDWIFEARGGLALEYRSWRISYTLLSRSREFERQDGSHQYGSLSLQHSIDF